MRLKNKILLFGLMLLILACNGLNKPKKPNDLIAQDKMVNILIDMSLLNAAKGSNKIVLENNSIFPEEYIFKKYAIDSAQFTSSNTYYAHNIDVYQSIYNRVNDSLKTLKEIYEEKEKEELKLKKKKVDSIKDTKLKLEKPDSLLTESERLERLKQKPLIKREGVNFKKSVEPSDPRETPALDD